MWVSHDVKDRRGSPSMEKRLTDTQLQRLVAEVQRLSDRHRAELDIQEVKDILQQIDLSPEFLDDAMVQLLSLIHI